MNEDILQKARMAEELILFLIRNGAYEILAEYLESSLDVPFETDKVNNE